ncbi:MAG: PilZ domain-containing protein [Myxococcota bacterium]
MLKNSPIDRRKYPRVPSDRLVSIFHLDDVPTAGRAQDLSLGGIRFRCIPLELELGALLRICLELQGQRVSVVGRLVRITDIDDLIQEFAVAFVEVEAAALELLRNEIEDAQER